MTSRSSKLWAARHVSASASIDGRVPSVQVSTERNGGSTAGTSAGAQSVAGSGDWRSEAGSADWRSEVDELSARRYARTN